MSFSVYVTYWDNDPYDQINDMIQKGAIKAKTRVILAFASFNFVSVQYIPGFGSITMQEVKEIVDLVHSVDAFISLSVGGATYPLYNSDMYQYPGELAANINGVLQQLGFDGVDFDIEDSAATVPADFVTTAASLINSLRSINPTLYISLTTPAQAWSSTMYQRQLVDLTIGNLDAWQPMEYDLWIDPSSTYAEQIQWDITYYITNWSVPTDKIVLGLMCGPDDENHVMMLQDALNLAEFAQQTNLKGVMIWDANIDGRGGGGNAPYAYSMGVQTVLEN
jgi:chitinase